MHGGGTLLRDVDFEALALLATFGAIAILGPSSQSWAFERLKPDWRAAAVLGTAVFGALFMIGSGVEQEFIYFQF
jgi:hypothetical protein